jgi:hypothetical protein
MISDIFLILTCTASLTLHKTSNVTIQNQCPDIELVSPIYFCDGGTYNEYFVERTNVSSMVKIDLRFSLDKLPGGILMYKVQRKGNTKLDHQSHTDTTSIEAVEDASKMMRLLVAWKIESSDKLRARIMPVEHSNELVLNEDRLAQLYEKIDGQSYRRYSFFKSTWLVYDNTVLKVTYEAVQKEDFELKITISEGAKGEDTMKPVWIDSIR